MQETYEYKDFLKKLNEGKINILVDFAKARQELFNIHYKPVVYFYFTMLLLLLICCISSFFALGWFGILYIIIYLTIWFSFFGVCSMPQSNNYGNNIIILGTIAVILSTWIFNFITTFLIAISFIELYLTFYFYRYCANELINNFILKDINYYDLWINTVFFVKD